tara:strand:+ start:48887 stop:49735 length:849 start_codon:yes stop_codon:yes gene_type:complete
MGFNWKCPDLEPGNWHYDDFIRASSIAVEKWQQRPVEHQASVIENIKEEGNAAAERITQIYALLGSIINFGLVALGAVAVLSQSILKTQPLLLVVPFALFATCVAIAAYALSPPHVELKGGDQLSRLSTQIGEQSKIEGGWRLAQEISERKTVVIRHNKLEWIAGIVRVPISLFIFSIISIPLVAVFSKGDVGSEAAKPNSITVEIENEHLNSEVSDLKSSFETLKKGFEKFQKGVSDECQSTNQAISELNGTIEKRFYAIEMSISKLAKPEKRDRGLKQNQ